VNPLKPTSAPFGISAAASSAVMIGNEIFSLMVVALIFWKLKSSCGFKRRSRAGK
jgi:hypothetical protein